MTHSQRDVKKLKDMIYGVSVLALIAFYITLILRSGLSTRIGLVTEKMFTEICDLCRLHFARENG